MNFKKINGAAFDSILLTVIQIVTYITNIVTTKILSVELSLFEYGTYSTVNTVITIAASLTLFGLGDSINYFFNNRSDNCNNAEREQYVNTIYFIQLFIGVLVGIVLGIASGAISRYYDNPIVKLLILVVCLKPWLSNATHLYQVLFVSIGKAKLIAIRNLIISLSKTIIVFVFVRISHSLGAIFACLVILDALQLFVFKYIFGKTSFNVKPFKFSKDKILPVITYTVPMGIYFVTVTMMREIDKLVIGGLGTTEQLAIYSNCAKTLPLNLLVTSFATVLIPFIMRYVSAKEYHMTLKIAKRYLSLGYLSVWMFSGALLVCAPEAIRFFYSSEYVSGFPIFIIYILDGMIQFASVHLIIAANGDAKYLMKVSIGLLAANVVLSIALYKVFALINQAILGPAVATVIISIVYVLLLFGKSAKILQTVVTKLLPISRMLLYLLQLVVVGVLCYFLKVLLIQHDIYWLAVMFIICGVYCLIIFLLHFKEYKEIFVEINNLKNTNYLERENK